MHDPKPQRGRPGSMTLGLMMAVMALFMVPMTVRETSTSLNREDFVLDQFELEEFHDSPGKSRNWIEGHLVSTGERYSTDYLDLVGLDLLQQLKKENKVVGYRVPVWYLPKKGRLWPVVEQIKQFRVRRPEDFELGFPTGLVVANGVIAVISILLIRRGVGFPKRESGLGRYF